MSLAFVDDTIGTPPPAPPARPRVLLIGTALACAGIVMAFAGVIGLYAERRASTLRGWATWLTKEV